MLGFFVDDAPIALKCNFVAHDGIFNLKIAYDERYRRFSPGVLLEVDAIVEAHRTPGIGWVDSCAIANHPMINGLLSERRTIQHLLLSTGSRGYLAIAGLHFVRTLKRIFSNRCLFRWR